MCSVRVLATRPGAMHREGMSVEMEPDSTPHVARRAHIGGGIRWGHLSCTVGRYGMVTSRLVAYPRALVAKLLVLGGVAWLLIWAMNGPGELELDPGHLVAVTTAWVGLALFSGTAAFLAGALTGRRSWGVRVGAGVAVAG